VSKIITPSQVYGMNWYGCISKSKVELKGGNLGNSGIGKLWVVLLKQGPWFNLAIIS